jgi:hypothetical protein
MLIKHTYIIFMASTSWNPQGLSRSVVGLLYLYITFMKKEIKNNDRVQDGKKGQRKL